MMYCKAKLFKDESIAQEVLDINTSEHIFYDKMELKRIVKILLLKNFYWSNN